MSYPPNYPYVTTPAPQRRRTRGYVGILIALVSSFLACSGVLIVGGIVGDDDGARFVDSTSAPATVTQVDTSASAVPARSAKPGYSAGTWKVPSEVKPGTYVTTVPDEAFIGCYWARVRDFEGGVNSIIANDIVSPGARGRFTVKAGDAGVELTGDCVWKRDQ